MSSPCSYVSIVFLRKYIVEQSPFSVSACCGGKQIQYRIWRSTSVETGSGVCETFAEIHSCIAFEFIVAVCLGVSARLSVSSCTSVHPHTSVWKSPSDESGVLAEEESQFLLCSSIRSFCSPGTMDSSGVMFLKLSQELWSSGFDLSLMEKGGKENGRVRCGVLQTKTVIQNFHKGELFPMMLYSRGVPSAEAAPSAWGLHPVGLSVLFHQGKWGPKGKMLPSWEVRKPGWIVAFWDWALTALLPITESVSYIWSIKQSH